MGFKPLKKTGVQPPVQGRFQSFKPLKSVGVKPTVAPVAAQFKYPDNSWQGITRNTITGIPGAIKQIGSQVYNHPLDTAQSIGSGVMRGLSPLMKLQAYTNPANLIPQVRKQSLDNIERLGSYKPQNPTSEAIKGGFEFSGANVPYMLGGEVAGAAKFAKSSPRLAKYLGWTGTSQLLSDKKITDVKGRGQQLALDSLMFALTGGMRKPKAPSIKSGTTQTPRPGQVPEVKPPRPQLSESLSYKPSTAPKGKPVKSEPLIQEARKGDYRSAHQIRDAVDIQSTDLPKLKEEVRALDGYISNEKLKDFTKLQKLQSNPNAEVKIYRSSPVNELNSGDWVTTNRTYANNIKQQNGGKVYEYTVKVSDLNLPKNIGDNPSGARFSAFQYNPKSQPLQEGGRGETIKLYKGTGGELDMGGKTGLDYIRAVSDSQKDMPKGTTSFAQSYSKASEYGKVKEFSIPKSDIMPSEEYAKYFLSKDKNSYNKILNEMQTMPEFKDVTFSSLVSKGLWRRGDLYPTLIDDMKKAGYKGFEDVNGEIVLFDKKNLSTKLKSQPLQEGGKEMVTVYHASPKMPTKGNWRKGTMFADTEQNARYYAESHHTGNITVKKVEIPKSLVEKNKSNNIYNLKEEYPVSLQEGGKSKAQLKAIKRLRKKR